MIVGASADSGGVTMVDSIKVYVKTKESFGWPEETDEFPESSVSKVLQQQGVVTVTESETVSFAPLPLTCADRFVFTFNFPTNLPYVIQAVPPLERSQLNWYGMTRALGFSLEIIDIS